MNRFKLALSVVLTNVVMYIVAAVGVIATFATFFFANHLAVSMNQNWLHDWVSWVAATTVWAVALLHYFLHRDDIGLARIDRSVEAYRDEISKKGNNAFIVVICNVGILLPLGILSLLSVSITPSDGNMSNFIRAIGIINLVLALTMFFLSHTGGKNTWPPLSQDK